MNCFSVRIASYEQQKMLKSLQYFVYQVKRIATGGIRIPKSLVRHVDCKTYMSLAIAITSMKLELEKTRVTTSIKTYPNWICNKYTRQQVFAILRYVNVIRNLVLHSHNSLQKNEKKRSFINV